MSEPAEVDDPSTRRRDDYPALRRITTRWEDEDVYGHVNNVVYYSYFDTAVNAFLIEATGTDTRRLPAYGVVAETSCRFLRELRFPADVEAGLRVTRLGSSSVVYEIALFQGDAESPAALGRFVHVYVTGEQRSVTPVPDVIRAVLEPLTG
ncbi:MAG: thioesterase family protein [Aeromicrobium sp.]|uniref:acyl-CoA thioesterase n=1 Tax=Aeromicrobium sp. TaxID=1871063 RepID=UPI0025BF4786|nr:thioesterase family protein [Aeromicrobium sp.]MCK5890710.1 acyl-CoA thioesterase [Aeromicrobium sp.]MDF1703321.1 thioesterase family protein [Aeromicrobium sp.]